MIDLPEGLTTTVRIEGDLRQEEYRIDTNSWEAYFDRRVEVSMEAIPGLWWRLLNPFTVGLSATWDRQDSLDGLRDNAGWADVFDAADESVWRQQVVSNRGEITYRPDPRWLITQVLSATLYGCWR